MEAEVNKDNFQEFVVEPGVATVVDFWGPQCARCFALMPAIEGLSAENEGRLPSISLSVLEDRLLDAEQILESLMTQLRAARMQIRSDLERQSGSGT